jgi:DeoR/GlpR family transcriptional regulator of sugar metabolism
MYDIERQNKIVELLKANKSMSVKKLTELVYASPATIRRDLDYLEKRGLIKRTFGGAIIQESTHEESPLLIREQTNVRSKRYMGEKCAELISSNQSLFLDGSSTVYNLLPFLNDFRFLSIITNGLNLALLLSQTTNFHVILIGGTIQSKSNSTLGPLAKEALNELRCDIAICSCTGLDLKKGVMETSLEQSEVKRTMMANSEVKILLVDKSKFGKSYLAKTCEVSDYNIIVTDERPAQDFIDYCAQHNVKLIY